MMGLNEKETQQLKDLILRAYADETVPPGIEMTIECEEGKVIWTDNETGETHHGCGERLAQFTAGTDVEAIWSIAADIYILHLDTAHGLKTSISGLTSQ